MADKLQFFTPVGRFVSGDLVTKRDKDHQNRPVAPEKQTYQFGVAFRKDDPAVGPLIQQIATHAHSYYQTKAPHVAQRIVNWMQTLDGFSMKISNGDAPNQRGQVNQNTVGCWVFWFSTGLDIVTSAPPPTNTQIPATQIKRGWFVDIAGTCGVNELTDDNAGVYLNPTCVRLRYEGDEIVGTVDPQQLFANHQDTNQQPPPGARQVGSSGVFPQSGQAPAGAGLPGTGMPGIGGGAAPAGMPGFPGGAPVTPVQGLPQGAPGGMPAFPGAAQPGISTASPSNTGFPQHTGILGMPQG